MTAGTNQNTDAHARLAAVTLPAAAILECHPCPAALWNEARTQCVFNHAIKTLIGCYENDFSLDKDLWLARVDATDRQRLVSSWGSLQTGGAPLICRYRFTPLGGTLAIELEETSLRIAIGPRGKSVFLSRYTRAASPVHSLVHKIGNNLQTIRGEIDLLRLLGGLPQPTFDSMIEGIESMRNLVTQIDCLTGKDSLVVHGGQAGENAPKSGDGEV
jgi:hypothetical protein